MKASAEGEAAAYTFKPAHMVIPTTLSITPLPPNTRRLSSQFSKPTSPIRANKTPPPPTMAWVSLQGRLIGADEASSAKAIGGGLSRKEAVAWELFSPIHRVLIVAVVAVAVAKFEKNRQIIKLKNCVLLRDEILMSMQQKLDDLCEQMNTIKDQSQVVTSRRSSLSDKYDSICTACWLCDQGRADLNDLSGNSLVKAGSGDEMFRSRYSISNEAEQEERRMSDLSDWASSVTSAADIQLNNLAIEQDTYNLKRECEEKDAAIRELSAFIRSKDVATSKRIEELEEVICRKNTIITKLKKDLIVLEQKVISLTRTRRRSFSGTSMEKKQIPTLTDNVLYDMDSPISQSSDSDCSSKKQTTRSVSSSFKSDVAIVKAQLNIPMEEKYTTTSSVTSEVTIVEAPLNTPMSKKHTTTSSAISKVAIVDAPLNTPVQNNLLSENVTKRKQKLAPANHSASSRKLQLPNSRPVTPLKENSLNLRHHPSASSVLNQVSASVGSKTNRRRTHNGSKDSAPAKRWM